MELSYTLDPEDTIIAVGGAWDLFADANAAPELFAESVIGRQLVAYIVGEEPQRFWRDILGAVRSQGCGLDLAFRCDSPEAQRSMAMRLEPHNNGCLQISTTVLMIEPRPCTLRPVFAALHHRPAVQRCSQCNLVLWRGTWQEPVAALRNGMTVDLSGNFPVSYAICPHCATSVKILRRLQR